MLKEVTISIYLDKRRSRQNGTYPVRLRVFHGPSRKTKMYSTMFNLTEETFNQSYEAKHPRKGNKDLKNQLLAIRAKAVEAASKTDPFTFERFERNLFSSSKTRSLVKDHYSRVIEKLNKQERFGTANSYHLSLKSLERFIKAKKRSSIATLSFYDISKNWLEDYELYMTKQLDRSITTVGIYLRALRAIYNNAIEEGDISKDHYPFGKNKYQIPSKQNNKRALSKEQLKALYEADVITGSEQEKARDFWFLVYFCSGINLVDLAKLKHADYNEDKFTFYRTKTMHTSKENLKPITVYLNDKAQAILKKYIVPKKKSKYVFDIINDSMSSAQARDAIKRFNRFVNQHIQLLCKKIELPENVSVYWARHSFATISIQNGGSMEFVQESLGHSNIQTTQTYFSGFADDTKKDFAEKLGEFE